LNLIVADMVLDELARRMLEKYIDKVADIVYGMP
jgi:hypothetical protein